jgi:hypothetical protein
MGPHVDGVPWNTQGVFVACLAIEIHGFPLIPAYMANWR